MDVPLLLPVVAAFGAGILNAIAGGGSFLTMPALVAVGVPPIPANATSALAVSPGYLGSVLGFRQELVRVPAARRWKESWIGAAGGLAGAGLLLLTPAKVFAAVVPWLLLFATAVFAFGPGWLARRRARSASTPDAPGAATPTDAAAARHRNLLLALVSVYGGYFNGGLGVLLMALYAVTGERDINVANAMKNLVSLVLSVISVVAFAVAGLIWWKVGVAMMASATIGGYVGARIARRIPAPLIRALVIVTGLAMAGLFFWRQRSG